jgi:hypothetical protein
MTLIRCKQFLTPKAIAARKIRGKIPLMGLVLGGRNGILMSPEKDPCTQREIDTLFNAPDKIGHAYAYVKHICFTPLELRGDTHIHALDQWTTMQADALPTCQLEPLPTTYPKIWKCWLHQKHVAETHFQYIGISLVGMGFQNAHIEGNRALLTFLPLNIKGTAIRSGPLWINFLSVVAALLGVPQRYKQLLTQKQLPIHQI